MLSSQKIVKIELPRDGNIYILKPKKEERNLNLQYTMKIFKFLYVSENTTQGTEQFPETNKSARCRGSMIKKFITEQFPETVRF